MSAAPGYAPLMMTVADFAALHGISESEARKCINGTSDTYPPLAAKRARREGSRKSRLYITAEAAAEWRNQLPNA